MLIRSPRWFNLLHVMGAVVSMLMVSPTQGQSLRDLLGELSPQQTQQQTLDLYRQLRADTAAMFDSLRQLTDSIRSQQDNSATNSAGTFRSTIPVRTPGTIAQPSIPIQRFRSLNQTGQRIETLINQLDTFSFAQHQQANRNLIGLTGQDFGGSVQRWRRWWSYNRDHYLQ